MRHRDQDAARVSRKCYARLAAVVTNGFFEENNTAVTGAAAEEMLRTLIDEVPPQMRETN